MSHRPTSSKSIKSEPTQPDSKARQRYQPAYARTARAICKRGASLDELAEEFEVDTATINQWLVKHEDFADACRVGVEYASRRVERAVFERARGYKRKVQKVTRERGRTVIVECEEVVPADFAFAKLWLTNCCPERWPAASRVEPGSDTKENLDILVRSLAGCVLRPKED